MRHPERTRYFQLRQRLSLHTRRLSMLLLGTILAGVLVVNTTAQVPSDQSQLLFRPFAPLELPPTAVANQQTTDQGQPIPTISPLVAQANQQSVPLPTPAISPLLYDDWRFTSEQNLTVDTIQSILEQYPGPLKSTLVTVGDRNMSIAEVIAGQAYLYSINPKILLALLEYENTLLSNPNPSDEQLNWALNFRRENEQWKGVDGQIRWATRELRRGARDYMYATQLDFAPEIIKQDDAEDEERAVTGPIPSGLNPASYALIRTLAQTRSPQQMEQVVSNQSFVQLYTAMFEDPRQPLVGLPGPSSPFLRSPLPKPIYITSFFDHEYPYLTQNGSLVSWLGRREVNISYDGHDGWDYGLRPPDPILAAASGTVVWAGNSNDGCYTPAQGVVIEHGNGYRTLYWHLSEIQVERGQTVTAGQQIGIVGASGCAFGPHLHFQTQYIGRNVNPYGWCSSEPDPWANHPMGSPSYWLWSDRLNPCAVPADVVVVAPGSAMFTKTGSGWNEIPIGVQGGSLWIESQVAFDSTSGVTRTVSELVDAVDPLPTFDPANPPRPPATARWEAQLPAAGQYRVLAYIPYYYNGLEDASAVKYTIHHANGASDVVVNQTMYANGWIDFGVYQFDDSLPSYVEVSNQTLAAQEGVWVGALVWQPVQ